LLADVVRVVSARVQGSAIVGSGFLRREVAPYQERGVKPRRVDARIRVPLALLCRLFD
jgi:hypothetical protein